MTRSLFRKLALQRLKEAQVLLDARQYDGAYYLAGYSAECALKACIARQFKRGDIPEKRFVADIYTHNLEKLLELARIADPAKSAGKLGLNWSIVKDWSEQAWYEAGITKVSATDLVTAVAADPDGVLLWLRTFW